MSESFDVVVIGGGLAGLTAGLFSARCGRSTLVLVPLAPGGELLNIESIEDFPGFPEGVSGFELCPIVQEQADRYGAQMRMGEVERLERSGDAWSVFADAEYRARTVILATGTRLRTLGVPGEEELTGRGVSHCASCDGPLFGGATVGVVGGGDSALQEALTLTQHVDRVIVFNRGDGLRAQETYLQRAREHPAIEIRTHTIVEEILGDGAVSGVRIRDAASGETQEVDLAAVFVFVGLEPESTLVDGLAELDATGRVVVDATLATGTPGLFAAGEVRSGSSGQAVSAAGDGAAAAMAAHRHLVAQERAAPAVSPA